MDSEGPKRPVGDLLGHPLPGWCGSAPIGPRRNPGAARKPPTARLTASHSGPFRANVAGAALIWGQARCIVAGGRLSWGFRRARAVWWSEGLYSLITRGKAA